MAFTSMVGAVDVILCGPGEGPYKGVPWIQRCAGLWPRALLRSSLLLTVCSQRSHRVKGLTKGLVHMEVHVCVHGAYVCTHGAMFVNEGTPCPPFWTCRTH